MKLAKIVNPIYLISLQYFVLIITLITGVYTDSYNNPGRVFVYIILPYLVYLIFYFLYAKRHAKVNETKNSNYIISIWIYRIIVLLTFITALINLRAVIIISKNLGGLGALFNSISNPAYIWDIQNRITSDISYQGVGQAVALNYLSVIFSGIITLFFVKKRLKYKFERRIGILTLIFLIMIQSLLAISLGTRIVIVNTIIPIILILLSEKNNIKLNKRSFLKVAAIGIIVISFLVIGQINKLDNENKSLSKASSELTSYYTKSINNAFYLVDNGYELLYPGYWTLRPWFGIPGISKYVDIQNWYQTNIGMLPINSRADDFNFISSLGLDPRFNTLSIFGYTYMDFGFLGCLVVSTIFIITQVSYWLYRNKGGIYYIIYSILLGDALDQLRTGSIFSKKDIYCMIFIIIIFITNFTISILKNTRNNTKLKGVT